MGCDAVVSVNPTGSSEAGMVHQSWFKSMQAGFIFLHANLSVTGCRLSLESGQVSPFSQGQVLPRDSAVSLKHFTSLELEE